MCLLALAFGFEVFISFPITYKIKLYKAYTVLGVIKEISKILHLFSFTLLYKHMVRSHLDYCSSVWTPYRKGDEDLEKVQKGQLDYCLNCDRLKA